jgi:hypothetical protein
MQFLRFGVLSLLRGRKIDLSLIAAVIGVVLAWANAVVFQIFVGEFEADSPNWREDLGAEGSVYVFDGRVAFFWAIAVIALILLFLYLEAVALPLLVFAAWVTILDSLIFSITGGQDPFPAFAGLEEGGPASLLTLNILTGLVIIAGLVLAIWPNRKFLFERFTSLTGGEKLAMVLLLANALSYQLFFNQMNTDRPNWRSAYGVEEALYTAEGRLILAWVLAGLGLLAFFGARGILKWLLALHWLWAIFLDSIIQGTVGGEDVWNIFAQSAPYNAIQQLQGFVGLLIALTAIWLFTGWYRNRVIAWMDKKGAEITKDSEDFDHTSPLAIIAVILAFLFPIGGLVLAAIAKREIALAKSNVGGVNLVVAANITAVVILSLQAFVLLTIGFDLIELAFFLEDLFPSE